MENYSSDQWTEVAKERLQDSYALLTRGAYRVGPLYMAGYVLEMMMKAYCVRCGYSYVMNRGDGHNLEELWKTTRLKEEDIPIAYNILDEFKNLWSVDLRYTTQPPAHFNNSRDMVLNAENFIKQMTHLIKRTPQSRGN
jgi:hypothetical protein